MAESRPRSAARPSRAIIVAIGGIASRQCWCSPAIYASQRFEQFLIRDSAILPARSRGIWPGKRRTSNWTASQYRLARANSRVFNPDYGRSLYLLPLAARRKSAAESRLGPRRVAGARLAEPI